MTATLRAKDRRCLCEPGHSQSRFVILHERLGRFACGLDARSHVCRDLTTGGIRGAHDLFVARRAFVDRNFFRGPR
jgi:hypothetical protein